MSRILTNLKFERPARKPEKPLLDRLWLIFFIAMIGMNAGIFVTSGDIVNLAAAIFSAVMLGAILASVRHRRKLETQILFMDDDMEHLKKAHPFLAEAWNYIHANYRNDHAHQLLTLPRIAKLVGQVEFGGHKIEPATLRDEIDQTAKAVGIEKLEQS